MNFLALCKRLLVRKGKYITLVCPKGHKSVVYYSIGGRKLCVHCLQEKFAKLMISLGIEEVKEES